MQTITFSGVKHAVALGIALVLVQACDDSKTDGPSAVVGTPPSSGQQPKADDGPMTEEELGKRYEAWRTKFEQDPSLAQGDEFEQVQADLRKVSNEAKDPAMRANAALMLGALYEARSETDQAIDFYRHAEKLIADDAGPKMALALALASQKKYEEAAKVQAEATKLDPDNLENWLALAEMQVKSGNSDAAKQTYIDYERRRKGLIDGLTLKTGDAFRISKEERAKCARALASASDQGTGIALVYALKSDPEPLVRATVAEVMGIQRLTMYKPVLETAVQQDADAKTKEAATWALAEIDRDPVEATTPEAPPTASGGAEVPKPQGARKAPEEGAPAPDKGPEQPE